MLLFHSLASRRYTVIAIPHRSTQASDADCLFFLIAIVDIAGCARNTPLQTFFMFEAAYLKR
ncbi:MAG: hypothetical protein LBJ15_16480 [Comamonas sp.]|uniref:hypothetical protein n=1 Tax=Comamonas sp. TaxID=34028 RepID=UPI00282974C7|nr:hypothetical protein [Comamonas sp.]MDR0215580.1 hypothetical protein [Comamonas sp.]